MSVRLEVGTNWEAKFPNPFPFAGVDAFRAEEPIAQLYDRAIDAAQGGNSDTFLKRLRYFILHQAVQQAIARFPDHDAVECGCWKGHSTFIVASLMQQGGSHGRLHVFDAFEGGLSAFGPEDRASLSDEQIDALSDHFRSDEAEVRSALAPFDFVDFYPGWIPNRFEEVADRRFGFVSVDVDLYEPTAQSIAFFWPRLEQGGFAFFDDFGTTTFPGARRAIEEVLRTDPPSVLLRMPFGSAIAIK